LVFRFALPPTTMSFFLSVCLRLRHIHLFPSLPLFSFKRPLPPLLCFSVWIMSFELRIMNQVFLVTYELSLFNYLWTYGLMVMYF
jgi:hypothetical protein